MKRPLSYYQPRVVVDCCYLRRKVRKAKTVKAQITIFVVVSWKNGGQPSTVNLGREAGRRNDPWSAETYTMSDVHRRLRYEV